MRKSKPLERILVTLAWTLALLLIGCGGSPTPNHPKTQGPRAPHSAEPTATTVAERYNLEQDEERGGHTVNKHVGRTDRQLKDRLERERNISAASTWPDLDTAETTVAAALRAEHGSIENWMRRGYPRPNLAFHYDAGHFIGRSLRRSDAQPVDCTAAVIVLRADGPSSFYVLTTYPEARE